MGGRGATSSHGKTKAKAKPRQKGHLTADEIPKTPEETAKYIGSTVQEAKDMFDAVQDFTGAHTRASDAHNEERRRPTSPSCKRSTTARPNGSKATSNAHPNGAAASPTEA